MTARQPSVPNLMSALGSWRLVVVGGGLAILVVLLFAKPVAKLDRPRTKGHQPRTVFLIPAPSISSHPGASPLFQHPASFRARSPVTRRRFRLRRCHLLRPQRRISWARERSFRWRSG